MVVCLTGIQKCCFSADDFDKELSPKQHRSVTNSHTEPQHSHRDISIWITLWNCLLPKPKLLFHGINVTCNASLVREDSPLQMQQYLNSL